MGSFLVVAAQNETRPAGDWRRGFLTIRALRSHPELRHLRKDPDGALEAIEREAPGKLKELYGEGWETLFLYQWGKVRQDLDQDPLEDAIREATENPIPFPGRLSIPCRIVGSVAAYRSLQSKTFSLPQAEIARMTGMENQSLISKAIHELERRGILKTGEKRGRLKLYTYHGPAPKIGNKPAPILPAPEDAEGEEPVPSPREPEERLPKWSRAKVDASWKEWTRDQQKLYREVYGRHMPGETFEGEAASLAMDAVLASVEPKKPEKEPEPKTFIIPQVGRRPWPVSPGDLEQLQAKYPALNVAGEIRKLLQKSEDTGDEIRYARGYLEEWLKRAAEKAPKWKMCRDAQPGDPRDGEERNGKKWFAFSRCWVPAKDWEPREKALRIYNDFMVEAFG